MEQPDYCQSCGMPMPVTGELYGTNEDGTKNQEYCQYCFVNGKFTSDITMEQMIEICVPHLVSGGEGMTEDEARKMMREILPQLKRWK